jgi:hypothetical protein
MAGKAVAKKKVALKKKKPVAKKKKAAPKKNAYRTGGLKASDDLTKKQAKWDRDKAWLIKNIPPGSRQKQMIKVQIGPRPTAKTTK